MEQYPDNSDRARIEKAAKEEKKVAPVVKSRTKTRKKRGKKFADTFLAEDLDNAGSYIFSDVLIPAIRKGIYDVITNGADILIYGDTNKSRRSNGSKVSYRSYYDRDRDRERERPAARRASGIDYDDILFESRTDANAVLDAMNDIISQYGSVSILDLYDLAQVSTNNYTSNRYGWTNIAGASAVRVRDGYILKLPRAVAL